MSVRVGVWLLLALLGLGYAFLVYRRREMRVRGWRWLAALRGASIALVLLLLMDFQLPGSSRVLPAWTLLDVSPSMAVTSGEDPAGLLAGAPAQESAVITFGSPVQVLPGGIPADRPVPGAEDSRLAPALVQALETGASSLRIVTDLRIADPVEAAAALRAATVPVEVVDVGGTLVNAGVAEVELPATAQAGEALEGVVTVFAEGEGPVRLVLRQGDGPPVLDTLVTVGSGSGERLPVRLPGTDEGGPLAILAEVELPGDVYPADDARTRIVDVDPAEGRLVLVSWTPDWEPRFLLPVLGEVTGLPPAGYMRIGEDRFLTLTGEPRVVSLADVEVSVSDARMVVLHGLPAGSAPRLEAAAARSPRLLRFAVAAPGSVQAGEWFVDPEVPPSPLAGELAGLALTGLPPLSDRVTPDEGPGATVLEIQRGGSGEPLPAVTLRERRGGREAIAWAAGFWRWGFRAGEPREVYRRLWSGVAGWLLAGDSGAMSEVGLAPARTVVAPGAPLPWRAGPAAGGRMTVTLVPDSLGAPGGVPDTVAVDSLGRAAVTAPALAGRYRWRAEVLEGDGEGRVRSGLLVVEEPALDLQPPRAVSLLDATGGIAGVPAGSGRPLRTHPAPYLLLMLLLAAEWLGRRRSGLR
ncbi:MAG: hypothetical protein P8188_06270 [Gemmatimonadota bacterium]|jgi:hypothetical protein